MLVFASYLLFVMKQNKKLIETIINFQKKMCKKSLFLYGVVDWALIFAIDVNVNLKFIASTWVMELMTIYFSYDLILILNYHFIYKNIKFTLVMSKNSL